MLIQLIVVIKLCSLLLITWAYDLMLMGPLKTQREFMKTFDEYMFIFRKHRRTKHFMIRKAGTCYKP